MPLVAQKKAANAADQKALMDALIMRVMEAQSMRGQAVRFRKSRSRIERAQAKERYVTMDKSAYLSAAGGFVGSVGSAAITGLQMERMVSHFKSAMLSDTLYHQQMADAMTRCMSSQFAASLGFATSSQEIKDLVPLRESTTFRGFNPEWPVFRLHKYHD
jgi:hypothetical protein